MPRTREDHADAEFVAGGDDFGIALGAAGLQDGRDPGGGGEAHHVVADPPEERVRRHADFDQRVTGRSARGFIPAGHTGTPRGSDLRKEFPLGMQFDAKVLEIDPRRGEAKLSIRAVKEDAEKQAYQQYRAGVAREAKFGTFADLMKKST